MALATLFLSPLASAFSLDFSGVGLGTTIAPTLVVNVPGYGNVQFDAGFGSSLSIENYNSPGGAVKAIDLQNMESVIVTFLGATPSDVGFDFRGLNVGESVNQVPLSGNTYLLSLSGSSNGVGVSGATFNAAAVPEASTGLLGVLGALMLLRRRRA